MNHHSSKTLSIFTWPLIVLTLQSLHIFIIQYNPVYMLKKVIILEGRLFSSQSVFYELFESAL